MKKIAVMGANAARQKTLLFDRIVSGGVNRAVEMSEIPSGKGINFCRAARNFGKCAAVVIQFAGGDNGKYLVDALRSENLDAVTIPSHAPLRCCMTCIDRTSGTATELIEPSGAATPEECAAFTAAFEKELVSCDAAAICGTLPGDTDPELYWQIASLAAKADKPLLLDVFKHVEKLLTIPGVILKINREELKHLTGSDDVQCGIAHCFKTYPLAAVAITDGADTAWASDGTALVKYHIPQLPEVANPIGCGDTASAVLLSELISGTGLFDAFRLALGAASANAETMTPAQFDTARAAELAAMIKMENTSFQY